MSDKNLKVSNSKGLEPDDVTLCQGCFCATHTVEGKCGKCQAPKKGHDFARQHEFVERGLAERVVELEEQVKQLKDHIHMVDAGIGWVDSTGPMVTGENSEGQEVWKEI